MRNDGTRWNSESMQRLKRVSVVRMNPATGSHKYPLHKQARLRPPKNLTWKQRMVSEVFH